MADFLIGAVGQLRQANPNPLNLNQNFLEFTDKINGRYCGATFI